MIIVVVNCLEGSGLYVYRTFLNSYRAILIVDLVVLSYVGFTCINENCKYVIAFHCFLCVCEGKKVDNLVGMSLYKSVILGSVTLQEYLVGPSAD